MSNVNIGVLALQGAFAEHVDLLNKFPGVTAREIRQSADMVGVDGLILPGGESTVQGKWLAASDLGETLRDFSGRQGKPTFGTCAGFILLANRIKKTSGSGARSEKEGGQYRLQGMNVEIERNYFGRQVDSFEAQVDSPILGHAPFHAVFIRAPAVHEGDVYGEDCEVLASVEHGGRKMIVAVRERNFLGTAFHPELTTDDRWHAYFVDMVRKSVAPDSSPSDKHQQQEEEEETAIGTGAVAVIDTDLPDLTFLARGKVRDIYTVDEDKLLFVTTDRISAYDVIMENGIPDKGKILTALSAFWFDRLSSICPHHLLTAKVEEMPASVRKYEAQLAGRSMLVRKLRILPIEAIVRGYITGSAWKEYERTGTVHGIPVPAGMRESDPFPSPLFTPSTKADQGDHDENIHPDRVADIIGAPHAARMAELALALYVSARDYALTRGIIIADTKFEFGIDVQSGGEDGGGSTTEVEVMVLVDEVLTPDSSRFWPAAGYVAGRGQDSFDKQFLRDHLTRTHLDGRPGVRVPRDVVVGTADKYAEVYRRLTGKSWP